LILNILAKLGYQPMLADNGMEAVEACRLHHFDIILMDMQMPDMDGLSATRVIRSTSQVQPVIIALTANTMHSHQEECLEAGMDDFLSKPFKLEELLAKLEKWSAIQICNE
jgi:CheY-like chemotaxis protein